MNPLRACWGLDPAVTYLNHGSFGATPLDVLACQSELRARLERNPMQFFVVDWEPLHDAARAAVGDFLGAQADDLAVVPNATAGVNAALRAFELAPGDELIVTDHEYNACANALREAAARAGAVVVVASIPLPIADPAEVVEAIVARVTPRTRLALVDHVTSQTGLVFPIAEVVAALRARGVESIVDGAHAPGMVPVDLGALGAAFYTGNLHKWVCAPKGAAFLHVRRDFHGRARPPVVSHGANATRRDRSRFRLEWDWTGTCDPTAFLAAPAALGWMERALPGGWAAVRASNCDLARRARELLCHAVGTAPIAPEAMLGAMAAVALPSAWALAASDAASGWIDPLQRRLREDHRIEVPVIGWPGEGARLLRVSAQIYNEWTEYEALAAVFEATGEAADEPTRARR